MTQNRRIFLNIVATYGRSLYALIIGLFCGRWTLMALGEVDYGLMGVVGGLAGFITFFNGILAVAIGRYFAFSIGQLSVSSNGDNDVCHQWFSLAVFLHTVIPLALMIVGYPLGMWAIENFLTIPPSRVCSCVWVFRFVCVSCFVGMISVPFTAMYQAKQYIAELTVYSFVTTTLNVIFLYYMVTHPGDWLARFSLWTCLLGVVPQVIIALRAICIFPECKFRIKYCFDRSKLKSLGEFVFWQFFGALGGLARGQGMSVLVNKYFGPSLNATMGLANSLASQTESLSNAMYGAFSPAVTTLAGAENTTDMLKMSYRASKFGFVLCLVFVLPLSLEIDEILLLWLKNPPPLLAEACLWTFAYLLLGQFLRGVDLCFMARGKIKKFMFYVGAYMTMSLPVSWSLIHYGVSGFMTVFIVLVAFRLFVGIISVPLAKKEVGYSPRHLIINDCLPVLVAMVVAFCAGRCVVAVMDRSIIRVFLTSTITEISLMLSAWVFVLNANEKKFILSHLKMKRCASDS